MMFDVLVVAGMIDRKFYSKLLPLMKSDQVRRIYVIRRDYVSGEKITCWSPTGIFSCNLLLAELYRVLCIVYVLARYRPKVVIGIGLILNGIYTNLLGTIFRKKKILLLMGKNDLALTYPERRFLQRFLLKLAFLADCIGTRGTRSRRWLVDKGFDEKRIFITHNVFDFQEFRPAPNQRKEYDLIYVGVLRLYKRVDLLLTVIRKMVFEQGFKHIRCAIVGDGPLKVALKETAKGIGISQNAIFLPAADGPHIRHLLNQSKLFVMTSQGEGLPMAIVEAMSCGLPVVVFNDADIGDVVQHGRNGLLVERGDVDGFCTALRLLLTDRSLSLRLSQGATEVKGKWQNNFSVKGTCRVWRDMFSCLARGLRNGNDDCCAEIR